MWDKSTLESELASFDIVQCNEDAHCYSDERHRVFSSYCVLYGCATARGPLHPAMELLSLSQQALQSFEADQLTQHLSYQFNCAKLQVHTALAV